MHVGFAMLIQNSSEKYTDREVDSHVPGRVDMAESLGFDSIRTERAASGDIERSATPLPKSRAVSL